jgi:hypothetical protein
MKVAGEHNNLSLAQEMDELSDAYDKITENRLLKPFKDNKKL